MINQNYKNLADSYLFSEISKRISAYGASNPGNKIIRMGIGDVTRPLAGAVCEAMAGASLGMGEEKGFFGYGPEQGYPFLREALRAYYAKRGVALSADEIFVSDGAKSDIGNILDLFDRSCTVLMQDPVYPVYADTNIMDGRKIFYAAATKENSYLPMPDPDIKADIIYICSPNNPCGSAYGRAQLKKWVDFALENNSVIIFDAAYEAFIQEDDIPHSIFELEGADKCAIEFCSLSKTAGFTGVRCGYTVVPHRLVRDDMPLNKMWLRRQTTKFNGVSYIVQKGAEAVFSEKGQEQVRKSIDYYRENALLMADTMKDLGFTFTGGINSPYIWLKCPGDMPSWDFFDLLLGKIQVAGTPGAGFGKNGEYHFRLTAFSTHENTKEAMKRLKSLFKS